MIPLILIMAFVEVDVNDGNKTANEYSICCITELVEKRGMCTDRKHLPMCAKRVQCVCRLTSDVP